MKLGTKGRYAVMAIADLARHGDESPVTLSEIAQRQQISLSYLEQIFAKLRRAGLVKSVRGPGGGYLLGRARADISVSDVMAAVEEPNKSRICMPHYPSHCSATENYCPTHDLWVRLSSTLNDFLSSITIADVLERNFELPDPRDILQLKCNPCAAE